MGITGLFLLKNDYVESFGEFSSFEVEIRGFVMQNCSKFEPF